MMTATFPVSNFASWSDPVNKKITHYNFYVKLKDLVEGLPRKSVNTRPQNIKQKLYLGVIQSANDNRTNFHIQNGGLSVFARKLSKNGNNVTISFGANDGVGDGAHSYLSCLEANKKMPGGLSTYLRFYVVCNLDKKNSKANST